jgi:hypothetical protein
MKRIVLLVVGSLLAGAGSFSLGAFTTGGRPPPERPERADLAEITRRIDALARQSAASGSARTIAPAIDPAAVEAAVDRALERRENARDAEDAAEAERSTLLPPDPEAHARGEQLIEGGIASRRWTAKQATELREILSGLDRSQAEPLIQRVVLAINRDELVPETGRPF